jgi:putative NIF3 family GTP cyclohydrolase 1 type 2
MTAGEVLDRIKKHLGAPWRDATYRDTYKFGGPETVVTGIATTAFVTIDVIQRAARARLNMIVPHEVTYWNDRDDTAVASRDPLHAAKVDLLRTHDMVVFRMHDHMHAQRPDFTYVGSARDVGLDSRYETAPGSHRFVIPETTLGALAADVKRRTGARALRVVGDPAARVSRIQLGVGYATPPLNAADVDVVISGEQQEADGNFDSAAYVLDAMALGIPKGMIVLGHVVSEEAGMLEMAQWIKSIVPEVPVELVKAHEPFWVPDPRR